MSLIPLDLSMTTQQAFYKALSAANSDGLTLTSADITVSTPVVDTSRDGANTRVTLSVVPTSTKVFGPPLDRWYYRRSLVEVLNDLSFEGQTIEVTDSAANWPVGAVVLPALNALNRKFESIITVDEVTVTETSRDATHVSVGIAMVAGNLALYGDLTMNITFS